MPKETIQAFFGNVKRFLRGERARPKYVRPVCYACREELFGQGYHFEGRRYCDVYCVPPFSMQNPNIAGDPR